MGTWCDFCYSLVSDRVCSVLENYDESQGTNLEDAPMTLRSTDKFESLGSKGCSLCVLAKAQMKPDVDIKELQISCLSVSKLEAVMNYRPYLPDGSNPTYKEDFSFRLKVRSIQGQFENVVVASDNTMSAESFEKLQTWIDVCDKHHDCMRWPRINGVPRSVPSRLLDMDLASEPPRIRLVTCDEIAENEPRYATLSHCWGANPPLRLLQSNLEEMKSGIPFWQLPKTFQEAIFVARKLRIPYLWIDAVCIVQDSHQDWTEQASLMEQVYSNCYLNIAATDSADSAGGLGRDRNAQAVQSVYVTPANYDDMNSAGWFCYFEPRFEGPLNGRGWVVQERFLSPRVIHYLGDQIGWECSESMTSEGLPASLNFRQNAVTLFKGLNAGIADTDSKGENRIKNVYVLWDTLVMRYTAGNLTFSSDRPIAISGIARVVCRHLNLEASDFYCGLWRPRFADGLAWQSVHTSQENFGQDTLFGIPSWSWLSVNGEVWQDHTGRSMQYKTPVEVVELRTTPAGDPFGPVSSVFARIGGPMCPVSISKRSGSQDPTEDSESPFYDITLDGIVFLASKCFNLNWDGSRGQSLSSVLKTTLYLLLVRAGEQPEKGPARLDLLYGFDAYWCLVLMAVPQRRHHFRRIGFIQFLFPLTESHDPKYGDGRDSNMCRRVHRRLDECFAKRNLPEYLYEAMDDEHKYTIILQ